MARLVRHGGIVVAVALLALSANVAMADDILGGDPVAQDFDLFDVDFFGITWEVEVSSFVYDTSSASIPAGMPTPAAGQTLFAYLANNIGDDDDIAVNDFSIGNPDSVPVLDQNAATALPTGFDSADRSDPRNYFVNPQSVQYNWQDLAFPPPATTELLTGQWSVVYFLVEGTWTDVNGTVIGGGIPDNNTILGPMVPEPATALAALTLVCAAAMRRRG